MKDGCGVVYSLVGSWGGLRGLGGVCFRREGASFFVVFCRFLKMQTFVLKFGLVGFGVRGQWCHNSF